MYERRLCYKYEQTFKDTINKELYLKYTAIPYFLSLQFNL